MTAFDPALGPAVAMAVAGVVFGLVYFATLRRSVAVFATGGGWAQGLMPMLVLTLARLGAAVAFLTLAAKLGAAALIAAFLGFLLARTIALRAARRAA